MEESRLKKSIKIIAFCCNYCAYAAADLAGISRMQYPATVRIIRVPCSGRVDIIHILRAFEIGADGVIVAGCLKGGCHFVEGNLHAEKRVMLAKEMLRAVGIEDERLEMFFISSAMAPEFVEIIKMMTERISKLGPIKLRREPIDMNVEENKRSLLYKILRNIALKLPEKPIPVPEGLDEFGNLHCDLSSCIGCRKCGEVCPEEAINYVGELDLKEIFNLMGKEEEKEDKKRTLIFKTLMRLSLRAPSKSVLVPESLKEFWTTKFDPKRCVVCEKCREVCPEGSINVERELDLPTILRSVEE